MLHKMTSVKGSDLYLSTGSRPMMRLNNKLIALCKETLNAGEVKKLAYNQLDPEQISIFEKKLEYNLAI